MEGCKEHTFQCSDIPKNSFKYFQTLKDKKQLCDVTLQTGGESILAHRIVITAVIPYFRDILNTTEQEGIKIPNVDPKALVGLIEFAYTCKVKIDVENVRNLLAAACYMGVDVVRDACSDFLVGTLESDNVVNIRKLAEACSCAELLACADGYIKRNFEEVSKTKDFMQCSSSYIKELINQDDVNVDSEEKILEAVLKWVKHSPEERCPELPEFMRRVRMPLLEPLYLAKIVEREDIIRASLLCRDLVDEAKNYVMFPELRKSTCSFVTESRDSRKKSKPGESSIQYICKIHMSMKLITQHLGLLNGKWTTKRRKALPLRGVSSAEAYKNMYFFHSSNTIEYDPIYHSHKLLSPMSLPRIYSSTTTLNNRIYVCGGMVSSSPTNIVECFDPSRNEWTRVNFMQISCWGSSSVSLEGYIFVLGGIGHGTVYDSVQRYHPVTDTWDIMSSLLSKRFCGAAATLNSKIYICGGYTATDETSLSASALAEVYDPVQNTSTFVSPMTSARGNFALLSCHGKLYTLGGEDDDLKPLKVTESYCPETDNWTVEDIDEELES